MKSQQRLSRIFVLFVIMSLVLVACERPFPSPEGTEDPGTVDTTPPVDTAEGGETVEGGDTAVEPNAPVDAPADTNAPEDTGYPGDGDDTGGDAGYPGDGGDTGGDTGDTGGDPGDSGDGDVGGGAPGDGGDTGGDTGDTGGGDTGDADGDIGGGAPSDGGDTGDTGDAGDTGDTGGTGGSTAPVQHTVQAGENLYRIGLQYGKSYLELARINNIPAPYVIKVGDVITISEGQPAVDPTPPEDTTSYTVLPGDNLFRIGLKFGISWRQIAEANGIVNPNAIQAGQVLKIPTATPGPGPEFSHTVQPGETLFRISLQYGVSWLSIAERNNIQSPYVIYTGEILTIPNN